MSVRLTVLLLCLFCYMPNYLFGSVMFNTAYICKVPWIICLHLVSQKKKDSVGSNVCWILCVDEEYLDHSKLIPF